jgi:hypothetical protein
LKIWIPAAAAGVVRVTDHVAERRPLAANLASHSHNNSSPIFTKLNKVSSLAEFWPIRTRFDFFRSIFIHAQSVVRQSLGRKPVTFTLRSVLVVY